MKNSLSVWIFLLGLFVHADSYSLISKPNGFNPLAIHGAWEITAPTLADREHQWVLTLIAADGRLVAQKSLNFLSSTNRVSLYFFQYNMPESKETRLDFYLGYTTHQKPHPGIAITATRYLSEKFVIPPEYRDFLVLRYRNHGTLETGKALPILETLFVKSPLPKDWSDLAHGPRQRANQSSLSVMLQLDDLSPAKP